MSLLLNNSFWAKTLTYSVDLLHGHGLLLHTNHLLPLQYGPALSLRVHGDSAHVLIPTEVMTTYLGQAYQQLDGLDTTLNTISPKHPPDPLKVLRPLS